MSGKGKLIGWTVVLAMWTGVGVGLDYMTNDEVINTAEDIIEWINHDVKSGYVDSTRADSYIDNLEQMIKEIE